MTTTCSVVTSDTVLFLPHEIPYLAVKIDDFLRQAATDLVSIRTHPPSSTFPNLEAGDATKNALLKLALLLNPSNDITTTIQRQHSIALAIAQALHRQPSPSSRQPSPSTSHPRHPRSRPTSTATTPSPPTQPAHPSTIPHPVLTLAQKERLKDILTRTIKAITHDKMKSVGMSSFKLIKACMVLNRQQSSFMFTWFKIYKRMDIILFHIQLVDGLILQTRFISVCALMISE